MVGRRKSDSAGRVGRCADKSQNPTTGDWELDAEYPTVGALIKAWTRTTKEGNRFYPCGKVVR